MPRQLRIEYEGAVYHVMNRGDRREAIFKNDHDRECFLCALAEGCAKTEWQVHAYCLMENHFHLVLETPQANLVAGMKWLLGTYTMRFNRRHRLSGHLFGGRYKSLIVDRSQNGYLRSVCEYVHLNPVRAKLLKTEQPLRAYCWSSFGDYLNAPNKRVSWLRVDRLFGELGIPRDTAAGRREFERYFEMRREIPPGDAWKAIRRGWCLGTGSFREELLSQIHQKSGSNHYAEPRRESAEAKAERLVADELRQRNWSETELARRRKGDPEKVAIARKLRNRTTVTLKWIADRLQMGTWTHAANRIYHQDSTANFKIKNRPTQENNFISNPSTVTEQQKESLLRTDPFELPTHCL